MLVPSPFQLQRLIIIPFTADPSSFNCGGARPAWPRMTVQEFLDRETRLQLAEPAAWQPFAGRVRHIQTTLPALIRGLKARANGSLATVPRPKETPS